MALLFQAQSVVVQDTDDYLLIGFADHPTDTRSYLILQRASDFDSQDREPETDDIYIERNDPGYAVNGGIQRCELQANAITFTLSPRTASALESDSRIDIRFDLAPEQLNNLREGLDRICKGKVAFAFKKD